MVQSCLLLLAACLSSHAFQAPSPVFSTVGKAGTFTEVTWRKPTGHVNRPFGGLDDVTKTAGPARAITTPAAASRSLLLASNGDSNDDEQNPIFNFSSASSESSAQSAQNAGNETTTTTTTTGTQAPRSSLWQSLDDFGASFKARAEKASLDAFNQKKTAKTFLYNLKSSLYYFVFILYRAYRGFFVLLPEVFRQVYQKLEATMDDYNAALLQDPDGAVSSGDDKKAVTKMIVANGDAVVNNGDDSVGDGDSMDAAPPRWRTKATVSVLATVVTASYVVGGAMRVANMFFKTITKRETSLQGSFEAAVGEVDKNEDRIKKLSQRNAQSDGGAN